MEVSFPTMAAGRLVEWLRGDAPLGFATEPRALEEASALRTSASADPAMTRSSVAASMAGKWNGRA
jgi:hypothetical protein